MTRHASCAQLGPKRRPSRPPSFEGYPSSQRVATLAAVKKGSKPGGAASSATNAAASAPVFAAIPFPPGLSLSVAETPEIVPSFTEREQEVGGWVAEEKRRGDRPNPRGRVGDGEDARQKAPRKSGRRNAGRLHRLGLAQPPRRRSRAGDSGKARQIHMTAAPLPQTLCPSRGKTRGRVELPRARVRLPRARVQTRRARVEPRRARRHSRRDFRQLFHAAPGASPRTRRTLVRTHRTSARTRPTSMRAHRTSPRAQGSSRRAPFPQ